MQSRPHPATLVGAKQIAFCLGVSTATVRRMARRGYLRGAYKLNGPTSPLRMSVEAIERLKGTSSFND